MIENSKDTFSSRPELPSMFWAAACASALPMAFGFIGLYFCFVPTAVGGVMFHDYMFSIPISLCFAFGAPLVAWLSCRDLIFRSYEQKAKLFETSGVWLSASKYSFFVHGLGFLTHLAILTVFAGDMLVYVGVFLMFGGLLNVFLFALITLPVSLFCSVIFTKLYSVPDEKSDIEALEKTA